MADSIIIRPVPPAPASPRGGSRSRAGAVRGFTLIELLVVIGIVVLLASLLLPVFAQGRESGRQATCLSNLRQVSSALFVYAQDCDERLPGFPSTNLRGDFSRDPRFATWGAALWVEALSPYVRDPGVFRCPDGAPGLQRGPASNPMAVHLGYNAYLLDSLFNYASLAALPGPRHGVSEIALLADSGTPGLFHDWSDLQGLRSVPNRPPTFGLASLYCANGATGSGSDCRSRHRDHGVNVVFTDGHAQFVLGARIQGGDREPREWPIVNPTKLAW